MEPAPEHRRYRFGPLERRGLIAGWRGGQIGAVAVSLLGAIVFLDLSPHVGGVALAVGAVAAGVAFACWPVAGRTAEEWTPSVVRFALGHGDGRRHLDGAPARGLICDAGSPRARAVPPVKDRTSVGRRARPSPVFSDLELLAQGAGPPHATPLGVIHDSGQRTYTAVLSLRGQSFALLGPTEKDRRVAGWAGVLAGLAREGSVVRRLQWLAQTVPDDGRGPRRYLADEGRLPPEAPARRSYEGLVELAGSGVARHRVLLALQIGLDRGTSRAVRAAGGGHRGACSLLRHELALLRRQLEEADGVVEGALGPRALAAAVRWLGVTEAGPGWAEGADGGGADPGPLPESGGPVPADAGPPWPMAVRAEWSCVRTEATWHAVYWIAEWPRTDVRADFLGPVLLGPVRRSVAVVMEPLSPVRATRQAEQARTADLADSELRRRGGFLATARRRRESEVVVRREAELADGHSSFRFSGYVTVTAAEHAALDDACQVMERAAGQSGLELRRLYGDQERALSCALPLCRGLS